ncbi:biotin transporter BioY [Candidatus Dependentiae bacterium]|nr:biotin transporter BioY [Candidatus Dependentiae bacterium]
MQMFKNNLYIYKNIILFYKKSVPIKIIFYFLLSWFFAFCSQIIIPLPFNLVPISLQPLPLILSSYFLGWHSVYAYLLTIIQTAFGAPFFSGFQGGLTKLVGPTGGYILGFLFTMIFIVMTKNFFKKNIITIFFNLFISMFIYYAFGLLQLSIFVPFKKLLYMGFYPFFFGCLIKVILSTLVISYFRK